MDEAPAPTSTGTPAAAPLAQKVAAEFRGQVTPRGPPPKLGPPALNAGQPWSPSDHA